MKAQRIVEISEDGRFIGVERGFLIVKNSSLELGKIPLDDIASIITFSNYTTFSSELISRLAEYNIPLVVCDKITKKPTSTLVTLDGNYRQGDVFLAQAESTKPLKKSLWQIVIKHKLLQQAEVLKFFKKTDATILLGGLATVVKSGDPENIEGRAAAAYWKALMGDFFRRDRDAEDENILFNYGYTILRAATLRSICGAGLHPSLGLHHMSSTNPARLADDLIEPFRPFIDLEVKEICMSGESKELNAKNKKRLAGVIDRKIILKERDTTIQILMHHLAKSLAQIFLKERNDLNLEVVSYKNFYVKKAIYNESKRVQTDVDDGDV